MKQKYGTTQELNGLGQGAWVLKNNDVVVRKDYKVLLVDVTGIPADFAPRCAAPTSHSTSASRSWAAGPASERPGQRNPAPGLNRPRRQVVCPSRFNAQCVSLDVQSDDSGGLVLSDEFLVGASASSANDSGPPTGPTELAIAVIFEELTKLEDVGREDTFFELGVDSLMAVQVAVCIEERFAVELPLLAIFENPSVAAMAVVVGEAVLARLNR